MENWLELERRFRELAVREPELTLFATEGDNGTGYRIAYFKSRSAERELEALSLAAGKRLKEAASDVSSERKCSSDVEYWWRYLKNNSREMLRAGGGWSRENLNDEKRHYQTGRICGLATVCANECLLLQSRYSKSERFRALRWLHAHYLKAIVIALVSAVLAKWLVG